MKWFLTFLTIIGIYEYYEWENNFSFSPREFDPTKLSSSSLTGTFEVDIYNSLDFSIAINAIAGNIINGDIIVGSITPYSSSQKLPSHQTTSLQLPLTISIAGAGEDLLFNGLSTSGFVFSGSANIEILGLNFVIPINKTLS